jgi:hypothetical protein
LHLFDWTYARYRLAACNASGCSRSAEISVSNLRRDAVGYFKAAASTSYQALGGDTDISPDGLNFVASTIAEADNPYRIGAVYVFRRGSNGEWQQRARLVPPRPGVIAGDDYVKSVSISADGNTVVVGMPNYFREWLDEELYDDVSGEVYIFRFNGTSWVRSRLYAGAGSRGSFGNWVSINDAGDLIAVASGESYVSSIPRQVFIYRNINGSWEPVRSISAIPETYCDNNALSADGSTLVQSCLDRQGPPLYRRLRNYLRTWSGPNWTVREDIPLEIAGASSAEMQGRGLAVDRTGSTIAAQIYEISAVSQGGDGLAEVQVFHRDGAYSRAAVLSPGSWRAAYLRGVYGTRIAMSDDGGTIAVGDYMDNGYGTGPRAAPLNPTTTATGAVYIYRLRNTWRLANMVKRNYGQVNFGNEVALNGNGQTLIVGDAVDSSAAQGIGGDWANSDVLQSGAVWLY